MPLGRWDLFAPMFVLESRTPGIDLADIADDIVALVYTDGSRRMDKCVFTLRNPDLKYTNDPRWTGGIKFALKWGYRNEVSALRLMVVTGAKPTFPQEGMPMISVTAYDLGRDMAHGARPRNWGTRSAADIARVVATEWGFDADIEDSGDRRRQARIQPANTTTYEFLRKLADDVGFDFFMDGNTLHFHREDTGAAPSHAFLYYRDGEGVLQSFEPEVRDARPPATAASGVNHNGTAGHSAQTGTAATDPRTAASLAQMRAADLRVSRELLRGQASAARRVELIQARVNIQRAISSLRPAATPAETRARVTIQANGTYRVDHVPITHPTPETSPTVQARHASAAQTRIEMRAVRASAEFIGQPRLRARQVIQIDVVDQLYSGLWRVQEVSHRIDSQGGYRTTAKLVRNGLNKRTTVPANQRNNHTQQPPPEDLRRLTLSNHSNQRWQRTRTLAVGGNS